MNGLGVLKAYAIPQFLQFLREVSSPFGLELCWHIHIAQLLVGSPCA